MRYPNDGNPVDDSLLIPVVSAKYPGLQKALCDTSLFFGDKLDTVVKNYQLKGDGITSFYYEVPFINNGVISIKLCANTRAAYPDYSERWLTLDIHSGKAYPVSNELNRSGLDWIYKSYKALMKKRITEDIKDTKTNKTYNSDDSLIYADLFEEIDSLKYNEMFKSYVFTDQGIVFTTDRVLPHIVRALEPYRQWLIPYKELTPYILPGAIILKKWKTKTSS